MSIRKKMLGSMAMIMGIFIFTVSIIVKNSNELQLLSETSILSYGLANEFSKLENTTLRFKVEQKTIDYTLYRKQRKF